MKIVHVLPSLARGGGERLTIELANRQVAAGHEVALLIGGKMPVEKIHDGLDPRVIAIHLSTSSGRGRYAAMLPWIWRQKSWLGSRDVLHCHLTYGAVFATAFRRIAGTDQRPVVVETYHAVGMPIPRALKWLHARLARKWDGLALMAHDPWWHGFAERHGVLSRVIPVGVDRPSPVAPHAADAFRKSLSIPREALVVTTIGRLVAERRPRSYVPIFARIAKALGRDVHFVMGGEGPERQAIEADLNSAGIRDRVHLLGLVRNVELPLAISDLYLTANVGPVPGVAGLQAIAAGNPTLAIQLRENYSATPEDWIWSSRDPDAVASRAVELLRNPAAARKLADSQAAHLAKTHSAEAMAAQYEHFYCDVIASKARSGGE